jgi:5-methylcytosine-specific restriction protein A
VRVPRGYCRVHQPPRSNDDVRVWYHTPRWRQLRARFLRYHPTCPGFGPFVGCGRPTTDVDHRVPHRGDPALFWDPTNLDAYCHQCHAVKTGRGL